MDKIVLKDTTAIEIEEGSNSDNFRKIFTNPQEYLEVLAKLNQSNLSAYEVQNSAGLVCATPKNKECLTQNVSAIWGDDGVLNGLDIAFNITDVIILTKN